MRIFKDGIYESKKLHCEESAEPTGFKLQIL